VISPDFASVILADKFQEGLLATVEALTRSHAQRLVAVVESNDAIISFDLEGT